jgi:hypothetical protein
MATTTNYGWDTPDDTDLVKDGAAAIRTLGSSADTTVKNLNPGTTAGDVDYYTSGTAKARIAIGTAGQVLKVNSGGTAPEWGAAPDQTPLTTKGDLFTFDTADARLGVGANGTVLQADSAETTGLKWATPASSPSMTLLSTTNITATTEISVTGISQDYTNLIILIQNYKSQTDNSTVTVRFNADTGSNYCWSIAGNTSGNVSGVSTVDIFGGAGMDNTNDSSCTVISLPFYTSTAATKTGTVCTTLRQNDGYTFTREGGFGYIESDAISSFQWRNGAYNWAAQGTIKIYGVN